MCVSFPVWAVGCSANKQGGLKYREVVERKRGKKVRREWFFSLLFPWVLQQGFSLELPHFISCCAYLCVCGCVSVRCVHVWPMWGSCSTVVIYSGGLWPYLFSISLMLDSGFPPALPWPTGRLVWVGPLQNCLESAPQTHTLPYSFTAPLLSFTLLLPCSILFNFTICTKHPHPQMRSDTYIYSLLPSLLLCSALAVCLALTILLAISGHQLPAFSHMQTCKQPHRHAHTHTMADNHTHSHWLHSLPLRSP